MCVAELGETDLFGRCLKLVFRMQPELVPNTNGKVIIRRVHSKTNNSCRYFFSSNELGDDLLTNLLGSNPTPGFVGYQRILVFHESRRESIRSVALSPFQAAFALVPI